MEAARRREDELTKPAGALGRLEDVAIWLAGVQGRCPPKPPSRPALTIFAGDHGVAAAGVSAYPAEVTRQMVATFLAGGAAANVLAAEVGARLQVVDVAVAGGGFPHSTRWHVRDGSGRIDLEDALTRDETLQAIAVGRQIADLDVDRGADLLIAGDMGIGNTTVAAVLTAVETGADTLAVTGRGTGVDDATLARKTAVAAAAIDRARAVRADPIAVLTAVGGADIAAIAGFLAQAAVRRTAVVLDGVVVSAAALLADRLAPGARRWWIAGHRSPEPAQGLALRQLGLSPLLDLGLRLGEGTGALLAVPLLRAAAATITRMSTFAEAGVSGRTPTDSEVCSCTPTDSKVAGRIPADPE
ncbi:MAG: nicotinate-nucleotide--dimethylbenzimidazole phosphoribosyltransferase [Acidothermus sp.]|nr:nicotinate-nucleotide--dimethylbenzimidazole phosphoribosyltransferase [Acidothermus sp.]